LEETLELTKYDEQKRKAVLDKDYNNQLVIKNGLEANIAEA
jgi:hypothetical protein